MVIMVRLIVFQRANNQNVPMVIMVGSMVLMVSSVVFMVRMVFGDGNEVLIILHHHISNKHEAIEMARYV